MMMPGRTYSAMTGYRYGFNRQEKDDEIKGDGNSYNAEFWEYDPRIGRRWNVDPVEKAYESPYSAFSNNPIWNVDPDGADTAKYISNAQLVDAIKISYNLINSQVKSKTYNHDQNRTKDIEKAIDTYASAHPGITFAQYAEFTEAVYSYFHGINEVAFGNRKNFETLGYVLSQSGVSETTKIGATVNEIKAFEGYGLRVLTMGANAALGIAAGAVGIEAGAGPRAPFKSNIQAPVKAAPQVPYEGSNVNIYRGANGDNPLFQLKGGEYKYTEQSVRGLSLHVDAPKLSAGRGAAYKLTELPKGLKIVQQGKDPGHFEIIPTSKISQEQFQSLLNKIKYVKVN
jgi:RHS repeat-associated protein